jgi:hypothetical protein
MRHAVRMHKHSDQPFIISGALFLGSYALEAYMAMYSLPVSQFEMIDWVSWILATGGVIMFFSAIINFKHR